MVCVDSFLASLYAQEIHSSEARRRVAQKLKAWITPLNRAELAHAFQYQVFRSRITSIRSPASVESIRAGLLAPSLDLGRSARRNVGDLHRYCEEIWPHSRHSHP